MGRSSHLPKRLCTRCGAHFDDSANYEAHKKSSACGGRRPNVPSSSQGTALRKRSYWPETMEIEPLIKHLRPRTRKCYKRFHGIMIKERLLLKELLSILDRTDDLSSRSNEVARRSRATLRRYNEAFETYKRKRKKVNQVRQNQLLGERTRALTKYLDTYESSLLVTQSATELKDSYRLAKESLATLTVRRRRVLARLTGYALADGHEDLARICEAIRHKENKERIAISYITRKRIKARLLRTCFLYRVARRSSSMFNIKKK